MADKSKMTVAEMLAAARKADGAGKAPSAEAAPSETAPSEAATSEVASVAGDASPPDTAPAVGTPQKPAAKKAAAPSGARLSVAEMLAAARAEKQGGSAAAAPAPVAKEKPAPPKPAAKPAVAAKKESPAAPTGPIDTQSILSAARGASKPGPMSKAEAAARGGAAKPDATKARAKEAIVVPPMPTKPEYAKPAAQRSKADEKAERRAFLFGFSALAVGFTAMGATFAVWTLETVRFMFPNILREPPSRFTVGSPGDFPPGQVEEKFKAQFGVWIVNTEFNGQQQIVALKSVCTHLGCTPNWLEAEQKFKCPCHGSGFYKDGINFEGPAPRPLERYAVSIAPSGEIEVDKSRTFQEEMGQWSDPASFIPV